MKSLFETRLRRHMLGFLLPFVACLVVLFVGADVAQALGRPELAPYASTLAMALFGVACTHPLRLLLFPYADMGALLRERTLPAAIYFAGMCFVVGILLLCMTGLARAQALPGQAERYLPVLIEEQRAYWPEMPLPAVLAAQVEQESRWNPRAELRTSQEQGVGLAQITRTKRFDVLAELRAQHPQALGAWSWENAFDPRLQLRALVLKDAGLWRQIVGAATHDDRAALMLAAYNGGLGGTTRRRLLCRGTQGCNEGRWWGHVERHDWRSTVVAQGYGKSASDINTEYPRLVMRVRLPKYLGRV